MTPRESQLLDAVERLTADHGYPPAMRELAGELGVSLTRVKQLLDSCEEQGRIRRSPRVARCYRVVRPTTTTRSRNRE